MVRKFSESILLDSQTVTTLNYVLSKHKLVFTDNVKQNDKYPNIDGTIEILNKKLYPVAKFDVQVKKLPNNLNKKFKLNLDYVDYAQNNTLNPFLMLMVDVDNCIIYWEYIDLSFKYKCQDKKGQKCAVKIPQLHLFLIYP